MRGINKGILLLSVLFAVSGINAKGTTKAEPEMKTKKLHYTGDILKAKPVKLKFTHKKHVYVTTTKEIVELTKKNPHKKVTYPSDSKARNLYIENVPGNWRKITPKDFDNKTKIEVSHLYDDLYNVTSYSKDGKFEIEKIGYEWEDLD